MSYAKNLFEGVPPKRVNKSRFNLSHENKQAVNLGKIIPVLLEPTMPGDEFTISSMEFMFRFPPLYYPVMHMLNLYCNLFWIPNRILWRTTDHQSGSENGWINFITMNNEEDHPVVNVDNQLHTDAFENDTVIGFMGFPYYREAVDWTDVIPNINALPLSAYLAVWDEYYRNPQIEAGVWFNLEPGNNTPAFDTAFDAQSTGRYRCFSSKWEKDYFTSALPTPQAGDPILIPSFTEDPDTGLATPQNIIELDGDVSADGALRSTSGKLTNTTTTQNVILELSSTIRDLRFAEALQTFKERILKVGQRYRDYIKGLFGNDPQPGTVDVPVWFGYYRGKIQISDTIQTATTEIGETMYKTGQYTGRADLYEKTQSFNLYCAEHGWILGLMEVKPNTSYAQGVARWWNYSLPTDYPLDIFAGIGDQEILKKEVLLNTLTTDFLAGVNEETFGYIPRYSEMKYRNGIYGGNLTSTFGLSQHFGRWWLPINNVDVNYDLIVINEQFINMQDPDVYEFRATRGGLRESDNFSILPTLGGATTENTIFCHILISSFVNRNLPMFSTPKLGV